MTDIPGIRGVVGGETEEPKKRESTESEMPRAALKDACTPSTSQDKMENRDGTPLGGLMPFPLLLLPLEIILIILRFLPTPDRLRARVNRMLYQLESEEEFYGGNMVISSPGSEFFEGDEIEMKLAGPRESYVEALKKIASNVKIGYLGYHCEDVNDRLLFPYIKSIRANQLWLFLGYRLPVAKEELTDDHLDEWIDGKKRVTISGAISVTLEYLHTKFLDIESGRTSLVKLKLEDLNPALCFDFLRRIGITYITGRFHSTRRDVEVYMRSTGDVPAGIMDLPYGGIWFYLLGERMEISLLIEHPDSADLSFGKFNESSHLHIKKNFNSHPVTYSN